MGALSRVITTFRVISAHSGKPKNVTKDGWLVERCMFLFDQRGHTGSPSGNPNILTPTGLLRKPLGMEQISRKSWFPSPPIFMELLFAFRFVLGRFFSSNVR